MFHIVRHLLVDIKVRTVEKKLWMLTKILQVFRDLIVLEISGLDNVERQSLRRRQIAHAEKDLSKVLRNR